MKQDGTSIQEQSTESTTTTSLPVEHGTVHRFGKSEGLVDTKSTTTTSLPVEHGTVHRLGRSEGLKDTKSTTTYY